MNGLHAIVAGLADSGVKIVTGVPGFPITELMEALKDPVPEDPVFKYGVLRHEWSITAHLNERARLFEAIHNYQL